MKVDLHTNLEQFCTSRSSDSLVYASIQETAQYLIDNEIDVNFSLYPRDGYYMLEELAKLTPNVKHIGVQVLMGISEDDATDMDTLQLDVCNEERSFTNGGMCYGIKIASHRGWWVREKEEYVAHTDLTGKKTGLYERKVIKFNTSGFDYGKGDSRQLSKWIQQLPDNSIVSMHMQGDPIQNSASMPYTVGMYAYKNPTKKFIVNHCGDFGQGGLSNKPKNYVSIRKKDGEENYFPAYRHAHHRSLIDMAINIANDMHNVLLDTAVYTPYKGKALAKCRRWGIGSDYPFQKSKNLFTNEEKKFIKDQSEESIKEVHKNCYRWLTEDWSILREEQETLYNL